MSKLLRPIKRSGWFAIICVGIAVLCAGGYAAWRYFDAPPLDRYSPLLARLANHDISADSDGRVNLAKSFPGLTPKDVAYIRWRDDGSFAAMFPTYYGEGAELAGLLYTSRPLQEGDTHNRAGPINFAEQQISVGTYDYLILEKRINPNWYHVSYKLH